MRIKQLQEKKLIHYATRMNNFVTNFMQLIIKICLTVNRKIKTNFDHSKLQLINA